MTEDEFTTDKKNLFKESVQNAALVPFADVSIDKIEPITGGSPTAGRQY